MDEATHDNTGEETTSAEDSVTTPASDSTSEAVAQGLEVAAGDDIDGNPSIEDYADEDLAGEDDDEEGDADLSDEDSDTEGETQIQEDGAD